MDAKLAEALEKLKDREWRLDHLYVILVDGKPEPFVARPEQREFRLNRHNRNFVPKARKLGISTEIVIENGDDCVFNLNFKAAIVDRSAADAQEKLAIFRFAWENGPSHPDPVIAALWKLIHEANPLVKDNDREMEWSNGSSFEAGASFTGRTPQRLHLSEFGPICDESEIKGEDIMQGSVNAVLPTDIVDVETTMRAGQVGACARLFKLAKRLAGKNLTIADWRLHFFSWLGHPDYRLPGAVPTDGDVIQYFADLWREHKIYLCARFGFTNGVPIDRQAWYEAKRREQGDKMFQEYPSTIDECDKAMVKGAIYPELASLRMRGRVREFEVEKGYGICAYFDLGTEDALAAWLIQKTPMDILVHDWSAGEGLGAVGAVEIVQGWARKHGPISAVFVPHDADYRDKGSGRSFRSQMSDPGLLPAAMVKVVPRTPDVWVGVGEVRKRIKRMWFHTRVDQAVRHGEEELPGGLGRLEGYRKKDNGLIQKDLCEHTADAMRTYAEADALGMIEAACSAGYSNVPFNNTGTAPQQQVRAIMGMRG